MAVFNYHAKDHQGLSLTGIVEAKAFDEAISLLRKKELIIISVKEMRAKRLEQKKINLRDLVVFTRQLATMIEAGITIVHSLHILKDQSKNKTLTLAVIDIRDQILNGSSLNSAMSRHPKIFSSLYVSLVRTGEIAGCLNETLDRIAIHLEKSLTLERKVRSALIYPIVVISMAFIITSALLIKVVPMFAEMFKTLGGQLPIPTQILILVSNIARKYFLLVLGAGFLMATGFKRYISTPKGRRKFDSAVLRIPVFGELIQKFIIAKFARTLSTLIRSAIPILQSLVIVGRVSGNKLVEEILAKACKAVKHGEPIAEPLSHYSGVFPPMVVGMISVGEQTGQLDKMLTKIAESYEEEVDAMVSGLSSLIEPFVIAFLGIVIGSIVIALFMPIFKMVELIH